MGQSLSSVSSRSLVSGMKAGDTADWEKYILYYDRLVRHWCRQSGVPAHNIDDVTQDVHRNVVEYIHTFVHHGKKGVFRAWLRTIAFTKAIDSFRGENYRQIPDKQQVIEEERHDAEDRSAMLIIVMGAVEAMKEEIPERKLSLELLEQHDLHRKDYKELATEYGLQPNVVRTRVNRARAWLRKELYEEWPADAAERTLADDNETHSGEREEMF